MHSSPEHNPMISLHRCAVEGDGAASVAATRVVSECAGSSVLTDPFCVLANIYITSAVSRRGCVDGFSFCYPPGQGC